MRRLVLLVIVVGFVVWRSRTLDRYEREHGYGRYAPLRPSDAN